MGFKDWFSNRRRTLSVEPDAIWLTRAGRLAGLCDKAVAQAAEARVVILAHFPKMLETVEEALGSRLGSVRADSEGDVAAWLTSPAPGFAGLALVNQLPARGSALFERGRSDGQVTGQVAFLVAERHPLRAQDRRVENLARSLPYPASVQFLLSLEDPLLANFIDDRVKGLLEGLGMDESEELSHAAISGAVKRAQRLVAEKQFDESKAPTETARSSGDWLDSIEPR